MTMIDTGFDLLRHGDTGQRSYRGQLDDALSPLGWTQMHEAMVGREWDRIVSSSMQRCAAFARELADARGLPLATDPRLAEYHFGDWQGVPIEQLADEQGDALAAFWRDPVAHPPPGGETFHAFATRLCAALEPFKLSLINSVGTMRRFIDDVGLPATVRANCDISHLHLVRAEPGEVAALKGLIEHVHLSDCDGQVHGDLPPGRGVTPIASYLEAIRDTGYDGVVSIELEYSPVPDQIEAWVAEAYDETDQIMQALDCRD